MRTMQRLVLAAFLLVSFFYAPAHAAGLTVISAQPEGSVKELSQIVARFSEPMRPLGAMEETAQNSPLNITVPGGALPPGNFRWLDPSTIVYLFDKPERAPFTFDLLIPAGTKALSGAALNAEKRWNITLPNVELSLSDHSPLPPQNAQINLSANYALRLDDLASALSLTMGGASLPFELIERPAYSHNGEEQPGRTYAVVITTALPPEKNITLSVRPGVRPARGTVPAKGFQFSLQTYAHLKVEEWKAEETYEGSQKIMPESPVEVNFSNSVSRKALMDRLVITPQPQAMNLDGYAALLGERDLDEKRDRVSSHHMLFFAWKPNMTYTIAIQPGLKDAYGGVLDKEISYTFTTGDHMPFIHLPEGQVMESGLGGVFPILLRNMPYVKAEFEAAPWGREKTVKKVLDVKFSGKNEITRRELNLRDILGDASDGLISMRLTHPHVDYKYGKRPGKEREPETKTYNLQITDIGLSARFGRDNGLAWVTGLAGGDALEGVELSIYADKPDENAFYAHKERTNPIWSGKTDAKGLATLPGWREMPKGRYYLAARKGTQQAVIDLPVRGNSMFSLPPQYYNSVGSWNAHAVTQMPLYQPGQTARFVIYASTFTDMKNGQYQPLGTWRPLAGEEVVVSVKDPRYKEMMSLKGKLNAYGSIAGELPLAEEAELGLYTFEIKRPGLKNEYPRNVPGFQVASFRPPDFKVDVTAPESRPAPLENDAPLKAAVMAGYFSGAALSEGKATVNISASEAYFVPPSLAGYAVGVADGPYPGERSEWHYREYRQKIGSVNAYLDKDGRAECLLPHIEAVPGHTREISLEATVTDTSGLTSQGRRFVHHAPVSRLCGP